MFNIKEKKPLKHYDCLTAQYLFDYQKIVFMPSRCLSFPCLPPSVPPGILCPAISIS